MDVNQNTLDAIAQQIANETEAALNRGIHLAAGQPLAQAVQTVAAEMAGPGHQPNRDEIRQILVELGWTE